MSNARQIQLQKEQDEQLEEIERVLKSNNSINYYIFIFCIYRMPRIYYMRHRILECKLALRASNPQIQ